jgi:putative transposase
MRFVENTFYHVFNRGNNKQKIFFKEEHYLYFLRKIKKHIKPHCEIMAYCLMPNHFHLLISTKSDEESIKVSAGLRIALSSYTRGINKELNRTGSLFQQNTKRKRINTNDNGKYLKTVFDYIHLNPVGSTSSKDPGAWSFSSFKEYYKSDSNTISTPIICNNVYTTKHIAVMELIINTYDKLKIYFHRYT